MQQQFAGATIAGYNQDFCQSIIKLLNSKHFFCEYFSQPINVEICGIVKNITAIACGLCDGLNLGENFKAAIVTAAIKEIKYLCESVTKLKLLPYFASFGDIFLTCSSKTSRNYLLGFNLAKYQIKESLFVNFYQFPNFRLHCEGLESALRIFKLIKLPNFNQIPLIFLIHQILDHKIIHNNLEEALKNAIIHNFH